MTDVDHGRSIALDQPPAYLDRLLRTLVSELIKSNRVGVIALPGTIFIHHEGQTIQVNNPG